MFGSLRLWPGDKLTQKRLSMVANIRRAWAQVGSWQDVMMPIDANWNWCGRAQAVVERYLGKISGGAYPKPGLRSVWQC